MPELFHARSDAKALLSTLAAEMGLPEALVEKDYWIMHCLWSLQQSGLSFEMKGGTSLSKGWNIINRFSEDIDIRFDPPPSLNVRGDKPAHIKARRDFYDDLAGRIKIDGVAVERNRNYDDENARNGGISLRYSSHFASIKGLKPAVLLEVGFDKTAPNEPCEFSSWALDRAFRVGLDVVDNHAPAVKCFAPEYTFVDKLQTICRRFRQYRDRHDNDKDRPRFFLRHYYDLYMLLGVKRVTAFMGTENYEAYKKQKLKGLDAVEFTSRVAFTLTDHAIYNLFEKEFIHMDTLLLSAAPTFGEVVRRLRAHARQF